MINLEGAAYVGTWCLLLWADGVGAMQGMQFLYGVATSTEVAYYTYIYAKVPKDDYKMASSLTRGAILTGKFVSGLLGQVLDSTQALSYRDLNYVSLTSVGVAMVFSFFLPRVRTSIYFHKNADYGSTGERRSIDEESDKDSDKDSGDSSSSTKEGISAEQLKRPSTAKVFRTIIMEAKTIYSDSYVVKWSIWVAASTCLNFQVRQLRDTDLSGIVTNDPFQFPFPIRLATTSRACGRRSSPSRTATSTTGRWRRPPR